MTLTSSITLFLALILLAVIPGPGVLAVTARTATEGLRHGLTVSVGIVAGDFVFITLALLGLSALSELMGSLFFAIKYIGAVYLIWLGFGLLFVKSKPLTKPKLRAASHANSFLIGFVTTIGNPKAILFYLSFFPAFIDLSTISLVDALVLYALAAIAVGSVMFGYSYITYKTKEAYKNNSNGNKLRIGSGIMLITSGVYVAARGF